MPETTQVTSPQTWTAFAFVVLAVIAFAKGWVIPGILHDRMMAAKDEHHRAVIEIYKQVLADAIRMADRGSTMLETSAKITDEVAKQAKGKR